MAFFEFNVAMTGLFAAQRGLQVTSNNITNASTQGYSRQKLSQQAGMPLGGLSVGMIGTGVVTTGINRIRDSFIDNKIWTQSPMLGEYNMKVTQNSVVEAAFGEPSDAGFTKVFNDMFSGMSELSKDPSSNEGKAVLKEELVSFTKYFNNIAATLEKQQKDLNFEIGNMVKEINSLATRIQSLNQQIFDAEIYGQEASSFRDERDKCIDRLSEIVDVEVREEDYDINGNTVKKFSVKIAGQTLVDHLNVNTLEIKVREDKDKFNKVDQDGLYDLVWSNGNDFDETDVNMSGELKGLLDMRDGAGTGAKNSYNGVPYYLERLNSYVKQFAKTMNEQYSKDADGYIQINNYQVLNDIATHVKKDDAGNITFYKQGAKGLEEIATVKKDTQGNYILQDENGNNQNLPQDKIVELINNYNTKYSLFTHTTGGVDGKPIASTALDYDNLTAENFSISKEIYDNPSDMRTTYDPSNPSDTSLLLDLLAQKDNKEMFKEGDPKDYMVAIFAELGINAKEAEMYQKTQVALTNNLKNQRLSVSQVDTSEEFHFLIQYQQAYQSAAKLMNTIDGIYETTIFKLGNF